MYVARKIDGDPAIIPRHGRLIVSLVLLISHCIDEDRLE